MGAETGSGVEGAARLVREGQLAQAIGQVTAWLVEHPQDDRALELLGVAYSRLGQWEDAEAACANRVRVSNANAGAWANWATTLRKLGRYEQANNAAQRAVALEPGNVRAQDELQKIRRDAEAQGPDFGEPEAPRRAGPQSARLGERRRQSRRQPGRHCPAWSLASCMSRSMASSTTCVSPTLFSGVERRRASSRIQVARRGGR